MPGDSLGPVQRVSGSRTYVNVWQMLRKSAEMWATDYDLVRPFTYETPLQGWQPRMS